MLNSDTFSAGVQSLPVRQGIDVASTVPDDDEDQEEELTRCGKPEFLEQTPLNDHLLDAILAATPTTAFIDAGASGVVEGDSITPRARPLVLRTLHPKVRTDGLYFSYVTVTGC